MEESDRNKIIRNLVGLMRVENVSWLYSELISRNVYTPDMLEAIQCEWRNPREQLQKVFLDICKRGPEAFSSLVAALVRTGNINEALLLQPDLRIEADGPQLQPRPDLDHNRRDEDENLNAVEAQALVTDSSSLLHHRDNTYQMSSRPTGFALIINVIDFDGNPGMKRVGAEIDSRSLEDFLRNFGYEVDVVTNPKKKRLLCPNTGILKQFIEKFSANPVDACVVAIMSHGEENFWIQTSDCESMTDDYAHLVHLWEEIFPRFNNQYFPMMRNKPKIFIIQSCRGEKPFRRIKVVPASLPRRLQYDSGRLRMAHDDSSDYEENHPEFNHIMILQSTIPGYVSTRDEERGSPFIQTICSVFWKFGRRASLAEMIPEIAKRLQDLDPSDGGPQTCTFKTVGYVKRFLFSASE